MIKHNGSSMGWMYKRTQLKLQYSKYYQGICITNKINNCEIILWVKIYWWCCADGFQWLTEINSQIFDDARLVKAPDRRAGDRGLESFTGGIPYLFFSKVSICIMFNNVFLSNVLHCLSWRSVIHYIQIHWLYWE